VVVACSRGLREQDAPVTGSPCRSTRVGFWGVLAFAGEVVLAGVLNELLLRAGDVSRAVFAPGLDGLSVGRSAERGGHCEGGVRPLGFLDDRIEVFRARHIGQAAREHQNQPGLRIDALSP
jgi:hypothetical protein